MKYNMRLNKTAVSEMCTGIFEEWVCDVRTCNVDGYSKRGGREEMRREGRHEDCNKCKRNGNRGCGRKMYDASCGCKNQKLNDRQGLLEVTNQ